MAPQLRLNQVTVPSLDVPVAVRFYQRLGLRLIVESFPHYARLECATGTHGGEPSTFSIEKVEALPTGHGVNVYFELESAELLDAHVRELREAGVYVLSDPEAKRWLWREAHVQDPDNNVIILYHAGQNRLYPPWRLPDK